MAPCCFLRVSAEVNRCDEPKDADLEEDDLNDATNPMAAGPDFLVLGPPRTASTWLAINLVRNDRIWMPPVKELHYFDVQKKKGVDNRYRNLHLEQLQKKKRMTDAEYEALLDRSPRSWAHRYLRAPRDDGWYKSLFVGRPGQINGEATPTYIRLTEAQIDNVLEISPAVKTIIAIRHPLYRMVSLMGKMVRDIGGDPDNLDPARLSYLIESNVNVYADNLDRWERRIPADRRLNIWFEDVDRSGAAVLEQVAAFLGAPSDTGWNIAPEVERAQNASPEWDMRQLTPEIRATMVAAVEPELAFLAQRMPERTSHWRDLAMAWNADPHSAVEVAAA